mgnify:CR=1 FL=1
MSELLPYLLRPFWLIVLPLPIWLMWRLWHRQRQTGRWQRLLPEAFHTALLTRGKLRNSKLPWILLGSAWLLGCLALLGPSWQQVEQPSLTRADPLWWSLPAALTPWCPCPTIWPPRKTFWTHCSPISCPNPAIVLTWRWRKALPSCNKAPMALVAFC